MLAHREKMAMKKERRTTLVPGFDARHNKRVYAAMMPHLIAGAEPREAAARIGLPANDKRDLRPRWSKNDDPVYRKAVPKPAPKPVRKSRAKKVAA